MSRIIKPEAGDSDSYQMVKFTEEGSVGFEVIPMDPAVAFRPNQVDGRLPGE